VDECVAQRARSMGLANAWQSEGEDVGSAVEELTGRELVQLLDERAR
jgi:hypothetical protein